MAATYQTPGWNTHSVVEINYETPFALLPSYKVAVALFRGPAATYQSVALDTAPPEGLGIPANYLFLEESDLNWSDGFEVAYTRSFGAVPPLWSFRQSYVATFPAVASGFDRAGRGVLVEKVSSRVEHFFQRVSGVAFAGGSFQPDISVTAFNLQPLAPFEVIDDYTDGVVQTLQFSGGSQPFPTTPSAQKYFGIDLTPIVGTEIIIESDVNIWRGNIYERVTRYVVAK